MAHFSRITSFFQSDTDMATQVFSRTFQTKINTITHGPLQKEHSQKDDLPTKVWAYWHTGS